MDHETSKRVNYKYLSGNVGKRVTIVGTVCERSEDKIVLITTDKKNVDVHLNKSLDSSRLESEYVEVTGTVLGDLSINEINSTSLPSKIEDEAWDKLVECIHKFPEIF